MLGAHNAVHPITTSAAPGAFRPRGLLLTSVLEMDDLIGMGNEGRWAIKGALVSSRRPSIVVP